MNRPAARLPMAVRPFVLATLLNLGVAGTHLHAQTTYTYWDGGGSNTNLGTAANWFGNVAPANGGSANVVFTDQYFPAGGGSLNPTLEFNWAFDDTLTFAGDSAFTLGGTGVGLTLGSGITQNSTAAQTVSVPTFLSDDQTWSFAAGAGALTFNSAANPNGQIRLQGHTLTLSAAGTNTLNGSLGDAGSASALNLNGAGTLILTGNNTYTGGTTFTAGTLNVGSAGALGSTGTLNFTGGTLQYSAANQTDYSARFSGADNQTVKIDTNGQSISFAAGLTSSGGRLTKLGAGTLTLAGASTYTGVTTVLAGTLAVTGSVQSGGTSFLVVDGASTAAATLSLSGSGSSLSTGETDVGAGGSGTFNQSGGSFTTNGNDLSLAYKGGAGTYTLGGNGSSLSTGTAYVGRDGTGTFNQSGGSFTTNGKILYLGYNTGSSGTYTLSDSGSGSTLSTGVVYVGYSGTGTFNQSGGSFTIRGNNLIIGSNASSRGTYTLSGTGGSLSTGETDVGYSGTGTFNQSGGSFTTNTQSLYLGYNAGSRGTYRLSGSSSSLSTGVVYVGYDGTGTFNQSGGSLTSGKTIYLGNNAGGSGTYNLNGGTLTTGFVSGGAGTSTFSFNGGTLTAGERAPDFFQNLTHAYVRAGGARLDTNGFDVTVAQALVSGTASNTADGGLTKLGAGTLTLTGANTYTGETSVQTGTLTLGTGGSLSNTPITVGAGAFFNVTGTGAIMGNPGSNRNNLFVNGTATLASSAAQSLTVVSVGFVDGSVGSLTQSAGAVTVNPDTQFFVMGYGDSSSGTYTLSGSGSSLSTGDIELGRSGKGLFNQQGGSVTTNGGSIVIGHFSGSDGTYNLSGSGSSLSTGTVYVGANSSGTFNQSGGSFTTNGNTLYVGSNTGSSGTYNLNGGTLTTGGVAGGDGTGTFHFNGGTLQAGAGSTTFMQGLTSADVQGGGARIDTAGFDVTVAQNLVHDTSANAAATDGGLIKLGKGTLTLAGTNTYTGGTLISVGTLAAASNYALGAGNVEVAIGAGLTLNAGVVLAGMQASTLTLDGTNDSTVNLLGNGVQDTVAVLIINGVRLADGTYGATGSGASFVLPDFTGTGEVLVMAIVPEPSSGVLAVVGAGLLGGGALLLRRAVRA